MKFRPCSLSPSLSWVRFALVGCLVLCQLSSSTTASGFAWVQDDQAGQAALDKWATATAEVKEIVSQLRAATAKDREALIASYREKIDAINALRREIEPQLLQVAQDNAAISGPLHDTLLELGQIAISEDSYDRGYQLLKPLVDSGSDNPQLASYAALAAFGSDRFDLAKQWLAEISGRGERVQIELLRRSAPDLDTRLTDWEKEQAIRAKEAEQDDLPRVKLETTAGDIIIELYEDQAPNTVANFINLIEKGYYDGLSFHRVLRQFMAQGGCPNGTGAGGPGYAIPCECYREDYRRHFSGTLSMAHAGRDTGGSQFFLTFLATPHLDGKHTAFGRVIDGMDVLASLAKVDPQNPDPSLQPSQIVKATVLRKRDHAYEPKTLPSRR
jgi:cyclophilin family peptidyl-prolyl cis-trans isomerase